MKAFSWIIVKWCLVSLQCDSRRFKTSMPISFIQSILTILVLEGETEAQKGSITCSCRTARKRWSCDRYPGGGHLSSAYEGGMWTSEVWEARGQGCAHEQEPPAHRDSVAAFFPPPPRSGSPVTPWLGPGPCPSNSC